MKSSFLSVYLFLSIIISITFSKHGSLSIFPGTQNRGQWNMSNIDWKCRILPDILKYISRNSSQKYGFSFHPVLCTLHCEFSCAHESVAHFVCIIIVIVSWTSNTAFKTLYKDIGWIVNSGRNFFFRYLFIFSSWQSTIVYEIVVHNMLIVFAVVNLADEFTQRAK